MPILPDITGVSTGRSTANLVARTRLLVGEEDADFYEDVEIIDLLNAGAEEAFSKLDALLKTFAATAIAGSATVQGCADVSRWVKLMAGSADLAFLSLPEYAALPEATGTPTSYCPDFLAASGERVLLVYPTPTADTALTGMYYALPPKMTDTQGPAWHVSRHFLVCYYAAGVMLNKDNLTERGISYMQQFLDGVTEYRSWLAKQQPRRTSTFGADQKSEM